MQPEMPDTFTLERLVFTDTSTIGELRIGGELLCYILEDTCREGPKIAGKTAIPAGRYELVVTPSERFKRDLPLLIDVPGFTGIRIHPGNTPEDTDGCLLTGARWGKDCAYDSRKAFDLVFSAILGQLKNGRVFISIVGGRSH